LFVREPSAVAAASRFTSDGIGNSSVTRVELDSSHPRIVVKRRPRNSQSAEAREVVAL
jgi:hypothetical protein